MSQDDDISAAASLLGRYGAHMSWAKTTNRTARTANGRAAFERGFLEQADGDPIRAASLRKAYYADLTRKSVQARRARKAAG
jgi:hypothetical protein